MAAEIEELLGPYAHDQPEYARAFGTFLTHTDQKKKAIGWLTDFVNGLRSHDLFVDAGAGEGSTTAVVAKLFDRTIAIEPNSALRAELTRRCPEAEIVQAPISEARAPLLSISYFARTSSTTSRKPTGLTHWSA